MDIDRGRRFGGRFECVLLATAAASLADVVAVHGVAGWTPDRRQEVMRDGAIVSFALALITAAIGPRLVRVIPLRHTFVRQAGAGILGLLFAAPCLIPNCVFIPPMWFIYAYCGFEPTFVIAASVLSVGLMACERWRSPLSLRSHLIQMTASILLAIVLGLLVRAWMHPAGPQLLRHSPVSPVVASPDGSMQAQVFYAEDLDDNWRDDWFGEKFGQEFTLEVRGGPVGSGSCTLEQSGGVGEHIPGAREITYSIAWEPDGRQVLLTQHYAGDPPSLPGPSKRCRIEGGGIRIVTDEPRAAPQKPR